MMWGYGSGVAAWWMVVESLIWLLAAAAIVVGIVVLARSGVASRPDSARRILEERFARGKIYEDQFNRRVTGQAASSVVVEAIHFHVDTAHDDESAAAYTTFDSICTALRDLDRCLK